MPLLHGAESSSHAAEEQAITGPDQKGTAAAAASPDQQVMSHRCLLLTHNMLLTVSTSIAIHRLEGACE